MGTKISMTLGKQLYLMSRCWWPENDTQSDGLNWHWHWHGSPDCFWGTAWLRLWYVLKVGMLDCGIRFECETCTCQSLGMLQMVAFKREAWYGEWQSKWSFICIYIICVCWFVIVLMARHTCSVNGNQAKSARFDMDTFSVVSRDSGFSVAKLDPSKGFKINYGCLSIGAYQYGDIILTTLASNIKCTNTLQKKSWLPCHSSGRASPAMLTCQVPCCLPPLSQDRLPESTYIYIYVHTCKQSTIC